MSAWFSSRLNIDKVFFRRVAAVFTGTLIAQLIPIAGTLVLARIFDPPSFGIYSVWLGVVLFLAIVLTCRFEASLAVEADGQPRSVAVVMIIITIAILSLVATVLLAVASLMGLEMLNRLPPELLLAVVPTASMVAVTQTLQSWAAVDGRYRHLAIMRVFQSASMVLLQIVIGLAWKDAMGLGYGYLAGSCFGMIVALVIMPLEKVKLSSLKVKLVTYWMNHSRFPLYSLPAHVVNTAAVLLPVLIVASRFGAEAAGLLGMAMRMLGAPISLLGASVLDVFKRHAGQAYLERGECRAEYLHAARILVLIAAVALGVIYFGAEPGFALVFGKEWSGSGTMAVWLLPRFVIGFVASPLSYMVYIAGKQHLDLIWQLALLAMTTVTLLLIDSLRFSLLSYAVGYGVLYLVYLAMSYRFSAGAQEKP